MNLEGLEVAGYVLREQLSQGKLADIYRAQDERGREYAFKIMRQSEGDNTEFVQRFMREMRILEELQDPHIVPIDEWGITEDERVYLIMPYIGGLETVGQLLQSRHFSPLAAWRIIQPICETLTHIHSENILHRDIQPSNIFVRATAQGLKVYLGGFGFSKQIGVDPSMTKMGSHVGTAGYISPEAVRGEPIDHRADLYSLAVVIYEMLLGFHPIQSGTTDLSRIVAHASQPPIAPRDVHPDFPLPLQDFLLRGLAKQPAERYQSAEEMADVYEAALGALSEAELHQEY